MKGRISISSFLHIILTVVVIGIFGYVSLVNYFAKLEREAFDAIALTLRSSPYTTVTLQNAKEEQKRKNEEIISNVVSSNGRHILIDPGHGGTNGGAVGNGVQESKYCLEFGLYLGKEFEKKGYKVSYTRMANVTVPNSNRGKMIEVVGADIMITLHCNSATPKATGVEYVWCSTSEKTNVKFGKSLRECGSVVAAELAKATNLKYRGGSDFTTVRKGVLSIGANATDAVAYLELGFISNPSDVDVLLNQQNKMAEGIIKGVELLYEQNKLK